MEKIKNVSLKVVGVTFANDDGTQRQQIIRSLKNNYEAFVGLEREPTNKFDRNAIKVMTLMGQVGYIGKDYAAIMAEMMDGGRVFQCSIKEISEYKNTAYIHINIDEV